MGVAWGAPNMSGACHRLVRVQSEGGAHGVGQDDNREAHERGGGCDGGGRARRRPRAASAHQRLQPLLRRRLALWRVGPPGAAADGNVGVAIVTALQQVGKAWFDWQGTYSAIFLMAIEPSVFGEQCYVIAAPARHGLARGGDAVLLPCRARRAHGCGPRLVDRAVVPRRRRSAAAAAKPRRGHLLVQQRRVLHHLSRRGPRARWLRAARVRPAPARAAPSAPWWRRACSRRSSPGATS